MNHQGYHHNRGGGRGGGHFDPSYGRRAHNDKMIELVQSFRDFKPYLKKRLAYIKNVGRSLDSREEIDDIEFYLDVMQDILVDERHGAEQLRGYIDKIHEMIRKNPMTEYPGSRRRSIENVEEEFGDEDRPRSPSPGAQGGESAANNIPLIPTHGAHRTVEVNFTSSRGESSSSQQKEDEWGRPSRESNYSRHETYKDVDMRSYNYNSPATGRGQRRFSGESDYSGAHGRGRGLGRGLLQPDEYRSDYNSGRDRAYSANRNDWFRNDRSSQECRTPEWLKEDPQNGNVADDWTAPVKRENPDSHRGDSERRHIEREKEWRRKQREHEERQKAAEELARNFTRRSPRPEKRHDLDRDNSFERRSAPNSSFGRGRSEDERHSRSLMDNSTYPTHSPHNSTPVPHMGFSHPPPPIPYLSSPAPVGMYNPGPGLLPTPNFAPSVPPHYPSPSNQMGMGMHSMNDGGMQRIPYSRPPPTFSSSGIMPPTSNYRIPPPVMPRVNLPLHPNRTPDQYKSFSGYSSPTEPSAEEIRDITAAKAKNCFNRNAINRSSHTATASSTRTTSPGPGSPNPVSTTPTSSESNSYQDPRFGRTSLNHQPSHQAQSKPSSSTKSDAGNVLRPLTDPRTKSKQEEERRRIMEARDRIRHQESTKPHNKPSKLQELRKQFEKEGMFRLGRHPPKKQAGSFEDAIASCDTSATDSSHKTEKSKASQKEKDVEETKSQRSHGDKTDKEKGNKTFNSKSKRAKSKSPEKDKKKGKESSSERSSTKKKEQTTKLKRSPRKSTNTNASATDSAPLIDLTAEKPPTFKIPKKPKPKLPEKEKETTLKSHETGSVDKEVSPTPPDSPEPALSQVPDADGKNTEEHEPSTSSKSTSQSSSSSDVNPGAMEMLKQFLMTSADPEDQKAILSNPDNLQKIFSKIMTEISAVKGKASEESKSSGPSTSEADTDKNAVTDDDTSERGRSRERKKNTKRRSSLEKLHDALKEMRFDTMLPLGPRRCTRGESATESETGSETTSLVETESIDQSRTEQLLGTTESFTEEDMTEELDDSPKKRGRPRKSGQKSAKGDKLSKSPSVDRETSVDADISSSASASPASTTPALTKPKAPKGKRKRVVARFGPRKRAKKAGPVTRAQAALKKSHKQATKPGVEEGESGEKTETIILRRLTRNRKVAAGDTVVNQSLEKIKLESDYVAPLKTDPNPSVPADPLATDDADLFTNFDPAFLSDDHLNQMIDEHITTEDFANLDKQAGENMGLFGFNTMDTTEEQQNSSKPESDKSLEASSSDLSYEGILNGTQSAGFTTPEKSVPATRPRVIIIGPSIADIVKSEHMDLTRLESNLNHIVTSIDLPMRDLPIKNEPDDATVDSTTELGDAAKDSTESPEKSNPIDNSSTSPEKPVSNTELPLDSTSVMASSLSSSTMDTVPMETSSLSASSSSPSKPAISEDGNRSVKIEGTDDTLDVDDSGKFKCQMCTFSGKKIVAHYVNKHYPCHIPQARLQKATFDGLLEMNGSSSPQLLEIALDNSQSLVWPCLYCECRFGCTVEFYDHLTTHTGEFRFQCGECAISYPYHKSAVNHLKQHKGGVKATVKTLFESGIEKNSKDLCGFLCSDCFYFQLRFESIMSHIDHTHHNAMEVRSVRLIRPSPLQGLNTSSVIPEPVVTKREIPADVARAETSDSEPMDCDPLVHPDNADEELASSDDQSDVKFSPEVFFGTDMNFAPPSITLNECTLVIPPVFEGRFLDSLLKKVVATGEGEKEKGGEDEKDEGGDEGGSSEADPVPESASKKRKLSIMLAGDETGDEFMDQSSCDDSISVNSVTPVKVDRRVMKTGVRTSQPRVCILKKMKLKAARKKLELNPEEPNNFYQSSDEESSEESSEEDEDESEKEDVIVKTEPVDPDESQFLRSNEHLVKTKAFEDDPGMNAFMEKKKLTYIRRAGDFHAPNTVLFGYIKPPSASGSAKLRDAKELDRLGGVQGKRMLPMKSLKSLAEMLTKEKLLHLFKCMAMYCSFTTDSPQEFLNHLNVEHEPLGINNCARFIDYETSQLLKDADCCSYCSARYKHYKDLVHHVINQHGQSAYQCNKCFYRAFYQRYVVRHFDMEHPTENLQVYKCVRKIQMQTQEATLFQIFVYKCNIDNPSCDKTRRFVFREDYLEHLENCVPRQGLYPCHLCDEQVTFENLIEHYKTHNLFKFHCSYCQFGSEVKTDLDEHFVHVHPNTSGRVFYRVKPTGNNQAQMGVVHGSVNAYKTAASKVVEEHTDAEKGDENKAEGDNGNLEKEATPNLETGGIDEEDGEKGRVTNLKGRDLYRCVTGDCTYSSEDSESFKEHVTNCSSVSDSRSLSCAHCERKLKTVTNLLEHMRVHGEKKQVCSICAFRCWTSTEITKHVKTVHKVMSYKLIKKEATETDVDPDVVAFPKDVFVKSLCDIESFENNYYSFTKKAVYSFENIDKLPMCKVFSADLYCAMCSYSTKVRTNIIRHLGIHKLALEDGMTVVPIMPRINPVPYLSRESLEFDKMMNLAASSHKTDGTAATADEVRKLPQFVKDQFRYVCSVCDHITSDESLLQTHIKVIHSEVTLYQCPHCQKFPESKDNPEYTVPLDKIANHLRLHGSKLYKCGHCTVVHHQLRLMEKHIPEKHPEKKPIHYLIRDVDPDGVPSNRPSTSGINRRQSADDPKLLNTEKWKCFLCSSKSIFGSWEETKSHCELVHKVNSQFTCLVCDFSSDDVTEMVTHCKENCKSEEKNKILVMFSKCEAFDGEDYTMTTPVWKRHGGAVRHIHGNFTEDSVALIKHYTSQQTSNNDQPLAATSPTKGANQVSSVTSKNPMKPTTSAKARRSVGCSTPSKQSAPKTPVATTGSVLAGDQRPEFKFACTKCKIYKTKQLSELRIHLLNELRYKRWKCMTCDTTFTTEKSLKGHIEKDHQKSFEKGLYELLPEVPEVEADINTCMDEQIQLFNSTVLQAQI